MRSAPATPRPAASATVWAVALGLCCWSAALVASATSPDSAGLVGSSPDNPSLPFKLWARSPKSALKPRRRDLREADLRRQLGDDFEPRWMRTSAHYGAELLEGPRQSVLKLEALVAREALPEELPAETREQLRQWLVRRATCPVRYTWTDLGPYFWPRWVRRGQCAVSSAAAAVITPADDILPLSLAGVGGGAAAARNASAGGGVGGGEGGAEGVGPRPCSWPPGMRCVPSAGKVLQLLRWHCRLRKSALSNSVWMQPADRKKKRRKRFRCQWLKVPYPVPEDCTCA